MACMAISCNMAVAQERPLTHKTVKIIISGMDYIPANARINVGDKVIWDNEDIVSHTVTAENGAWDLGDIQPGMAKALIFKAPGEISYLCTYHPGMVGTLTVQADDAQQPQPPRTSANPQQQPSTAANAASMPEAMHMPIHPSAPRRIHRTPKA
nr:MULTISPECIES: plastocyanin/azurin family copper-binding protein [unclassified Rhizobium]